MSLEGRLRELGLPEVLQLLGLSRKTGVLRLRAQVQGRAGFVRLVNGAVVDASQWRLADRPDGDDAPGLATTSTSTRVVEGCVLDLLTWRDGDFRFSPEEGSPAPSPVRIAVDMLLVESAQHAERWEGLNDRIPHAHVVPAFVDVEPQQLPLLRLVPQEWEILTRVDGSRDLTELASVLGRDLLDVAEIVHGLIGSGLLALREAERAPRRNPTPPIGVTPQTAPALSTAAGDTPSAATAAISAVDTPRSTPLPASTDLWIPSRTDGNDADDETADEDTLFDPVELGVFTPDGMPRRRTGPRGAVAVTAQPHEHTSERVAPTVAETSLNRGLAEWPKQEMDATSLCVHGDDAARRGDLAGALAFWSAALRSEASHADADRIREAIALAARLHALLHPAARST
jgi:Domain of unknown function (DUF4388)